MTRNTYDDVQVYEMREVFRVKADAISLVELFHTTNTAYVIPSYQRRFVWGPDKAEELLEGIFNDFINEDAVHLTSIGTILVCGVPTGARNPYGKKDQQTKAPNIIWEVVDGQQRLTFFAIAAHALKMRLDNLMQEGLDYSPSSELELFYSTARRATGNERVPCIIREEDNFDVHPFQSPVAQLLSRFISGSNSPYTAVEDEAMEAERLELVCQTVSSWVDAKLNAVNLGDFTEYFLQGCQVIRVEADNQDVAFNMFEPLNSTSEPLTALEVYRSKVVKKISNGSMLMKRTYELVDNANANRDEVIRKSNDLVFFTCQLYSGTRPGKSFVPLKKYLDTKVDRSFIEVLEKNADFLRTVWLDQTEDSSWFDDDTKNCIRFLKAAKHDIAIPLLGRYYITNPEHLPRVAKSVAAFFALWRANNPTNNLPDVYRRLLADAGDDDMSMCTGNLKSPTELTSYFKQQLRQRMGCSTEADLFETWKECKYLYYDVVKAVCRLFIFLHIGDTLKINLRPDDPWKRIDDIEHIVPQAMNFPWVNQIGNLTFLPSKVNRSISSMEWREKRPIYQSLAATHRGQQDEWVSWPSAVTEYLRDSASPAICHLADIATHETWGQQESDQRSDEIKKHVWRVLYDQWLA